MENRLIFLYHQEGVISEGVTRKDRSAGGWKCRSNVVGGSCRKIRGTVNAESGEGLKSLDER